MQNNHSISINVIQKSAFLIIALFIYQVSISQHTNNRWKIASKNIINWNVSSSKKLPHTDNIEMSGKKVAGIITYDVDKNGNLSLQRQIFFPQLHPYIKSTDPSWYIYRAYLKQTHTDDIMPKLYLNDKQIVPGPLKNVIINGTLNFEHLPSKSGIIFKRKLVPSSTERMFIEQVTLINNTDSIIKIRTAKGIKQHENYGADGKFTTVVKSDILSTIELQSGKSISYAIKIMAKKDTEEYPLLTATETIKKRQEFLDKMSNSLILETPDTILNTLFEFSKIRASESIFESKLGLIHSPGGGRYYVGVWANDQAEYISPFFPYLGYSIGNQSAINTYRAFAKETNSEYKKIRYAFEIEGTVPPFLLDRGDAAMIAYGASQYALALGDRKTAIELWPLITWCLEYCNKKLNNKGVVLSESDEMEGRIETGDANLSTSALYYGALKNTINLGNSLNKPKKDIIAYKKQANTLYKAIDTYFGANVEGLDTYRYYEGHRYLRHWICLPLVVGINKRKDATTTALFDKLWSENGVHVEKNSDNEAISKIFWDRGTLYALRGTFLSGATDSSLEKLKKFSNERLLGERVPYVVEAFPEGNMAHLSAESGLYCRVFIEGMFGITPTGLNSFTLIPRLPKGWNKMALRKIKAFNQNFDIEVKRKGTLTNIKIIDNTTKRVLLDKNSYLQQPVSFKFNARK